MTDGAPPPAALSVTGLEYATIGVGLLLAVVFLFAGILCVAGRPSCRWMFVVHGVLTMPLTMYNYMHQLDEQAQVAEWAERYPDTQLAEMVRMQQGGQEIGQMIGLVIVLLFGVMIPAFYIIWFGFVKTKREQYTGGDEGVV